MQVGIPINFSFQGSNVKDDVETLYDVLLNCETPIFEEPRELQADQWIYVFRSSERCKAQYENPDEGHSKCAFIPKVWSKTDSDDGAYDINEVVYVKCNETDSGMAKYSGKLIKCTGKKGPTYTEHRRPFEPEEYGAWDEGIDFKNYKHRYMRLPTSIIYQGGSERTWLDGSMWYYILWEVRGFQGCGRGGIRWSVKDIRMVDRDFPYQRTCVQKNYSTRYNAGKDVKAKVYAWGAYGAPKQSIIQFQSVVERNGYFYFRTQLNVKLEYATYMTGTTAEYHWAEVTTPADIPGFVQDRMVNAMRPFDGKAYTRSKVDTSMTAGKASWRLLSTAPFNTIAFGYLICDKLDIKVSDPETGEDIFVLNNYTVENYIGDGTDMEYGVTRILYTAETVRQEAIIDIVLYGHGIEIGEIVGALSIDAGFSNVAFKNNFRDFTPKEQDQWGNWLYLENGIKVHTHTGTVEFPIMRYDEMNRMMIKMGGSKVVVNTSDSTKNEAPDGHKVFDATMMIARFTKFELASREEKKRIGDIAQYNFNLEELV